MDINDRELLELAAKAAGKNVVGYAEAAGHSYALKIGYPNAYETWNPLANDGDALRLAVKLGMGVQSNGPDHWQSPNCTIVLFEGADCSHRLTQAHDGDPYAATRRAIVRAAAEIERAKVR